MADVFISYKRDDLAPVQKLVAALRGVGLSVWWDQDIAPDAPWEATIERELDRASVVIVAWSQAAVASDNVKAESRRARQHGKLIQVFSEPCEPPLFFGERQGVDLKGWSGDASDGRFQAILSGIRAIMSGQRPLEGVGFAPKRQPTRLIAASFAIVALVLVAAVVSFGIGSDVRCATFGIGCPPAAPVTDQVADAEPPASIDGEAPRVPEVTETASTSPQPEPERVASNRDPQAYFPNFPDTEDFCGTIRQVAAMVDQDFASWKRGEAVALSGGLVWRSSHRLPGATSCNVQQTGPQVPPSYACRWDTPSTETATAEAERLAQAIMRCPGAVRGSEGRPLIGNAIFWVHPVDIALNQVRLIVMWS